MDDYNPGTVYRINEYFHSIQGEGLNAGDTAVFVRLQGCPVGCPWCDSKPTWYTGGDSMSVAYLLDRLDKLPQATWTVITGGEPMVRDLDHLIWGLRTTFPSRAIALETCGAFAWMGELRPDWVTVSPKRDAGWHIDPSVLETVSELKYVVDDHFNAQVIQPHVDALYRMRQALHGRADRAMVPSTLVMPKLRYMLHPPVFLMPEGAPPRDETVAKTLAMLEVHPDWHFGPRLQHDYPQITQREGRNNVIRTNQDARDLMLGIRLTDVTKERAQ